MRLIQTRNINDKKSFKEAMLYPSNQEGGLYVPEFLPHFKGAKYKNLNYQDFAFKLIQSFEFNLDDEFKQALKAYENFDDKNLPLQLFKLGARVYINELYHGPTRAFKDMALQPFGPLFSLLAQRQKFLIICATSGDTGPATLKSFEGAKNVKVACIYPLFGTSHLQALQMQILKGDNLKSFAIDEDFDKAQGALKNLLNNAEFIASLKAENTELCVANSINFARILFQIIYHYYASLHFKNPCEIIIPSGNFGNALGAYYAKKMGANIKKIKIASNINNILSEFFNTGKYDLRGKSLIKTLSPAMDILISSNIERLIFDKFGQKRTQELFTSLQEQRYFELNTKELRILQEDFEADFCTDKQCLNYIKELSSSTLIDPHTATCFKMLDKRKNTLITATAEWTKFVPSMYKALCGEDCPDERKALKYLMSFYEYGVKKEIYELFEERVPQIQSYKSYELEKALLGWVRQ